MLKLKAPLENLETALKIPQAHAATLATLKAFTYAEAFSQNSAEFAQIAAQLEDFAALFEPLSINEAAASSKEEAAVLLLACALEAVADFKLACAQLKDEEIKDLFFRIWAVLVSQIQPLCMQMLKPANDVDDLLGGIIKQILNKE